MPERPQGNLFQASGEPLAARMRPRTLAEYVGQDHMLGPGRLLRRAIEADRLSSVLFHGPPGTGKTTLARVIAASSDATFVALNAVLDGVKDLREAVQQAQARQARGGRTLLFVDEVHRFNKAQQDALLPSVEAGVVTFIGATTQNPFFEVNPALVSRSRVFQLTPLSDTDLRRVADQALHDEVRGLGKLAVEVADDAMAHLTNVANGDARSLLNALELAALTTEPNHEGVRLIDRATAEESIQKRAVLYDKEGDAHYDVISAYIKSLRGSDPDAALYWLAVMVHAGEDPRYIFRRLRVHASEDVGLADPDVLGRINACAAAFDAVGMPEGRYFLAQATLVLAAAPKSNSTLGFFDALAAVEQEARADVPSHLKDANRDAEGFGHGQGYLYPHSYRDHWVAQQYLPPALQGRLFYQPSSEGFEATIKTHVERRREVQLAAMLDGTLAGGQESLSFAPNEADRDAWADRTTSGQGETIAALRDRLFEAAALTRHDRVLDLCVPSGWTTFEAMRRTPEGHVWSLPETDESVRLIEGLAAERPELERPVVIKRPEQNVADTLRAAARERYGVDPLAFDVVLAVGGLRGNLDDGLPAWLPAARDLMAPGGRLVALDAQPAGATRLADTLAPNAVEESLIEALHAAEDALRAAREPAADETLLGLLVDAGFAGADVTTFHVDAFRSASPARVASWLEPGRPLGDALDAQGVPEDGIEALKTALAAVWGDGVHWRTPWRQVIATDAGANQPKH